MTVEAILIIDADPQRAASLKEMIEFLDAPKVIVATPEDWQDAASQAPLRAVFIGNSVSGDSVVSIGEGLRQGHPQVPVVVVKGDD